MYARIRWALSFIILAVVFSSCSPLQPKPEQQPEEEIARQWAEIEQKYPEASRVIAQALLYMSTPLPPGEDEGFMATPHYEWKLKIGHCAISLLLGRLPESCMVDLSKIQPPEPGVVLPKGPWECVTECLDKGGAKMVCYCDCFPEFCF